MRHNKLTGRNAYRNRILTLFILFYKYAITLFGKQEVVFFIKIFLN